MATACEVDPALSSPVGAEAGRDLALAASLLEHDPFLVLADDRPYLEAQARVAHTWADPAAWTRMSILNTARMGRFSSDRAVAEDNAKIWHAPPVGIPEGDRDLL